MQTTPSRRFHRFQANRTLILRRGIVAAILLSAVAFANLLAVSPVTAVGDAVVKVDPASSTVNVDATVVVNIRIENVTNLAAAEVHLTYDPFLLEVQSMQAGGFPAPDFVALSSATGGHIDYAIAQMPPHTPVSGSGTLLKITFKSLATGTSPLHMLSTVLSDGSSAIIPSTTQDGTVTITLPGGRITGKVSRQGVPPSTGHGTLKCTLITVLRPDSSLIGQTYTNEAGEFDFLITSAGRYAVRASYSGYLPAATSVDVPPDRSLVTKLSGGDVNGDNTINIRDIVAIIDNIGASGLPVRSSGGCESLDSPIDINDDGVANISDLAIAAGNFGKVGPAPWQP